MLAVSNGNMVMLSSPFGTRGAFFEAWKGRERWERFEVPATEVPRISSEFLEEEKRTLGLWVFRQEYQCEFLADAGAVFDPEDIAAAIDPTIQTFGILGPEWE